MKYSIEGGTLPVVLIDLEPGEQLLSEPGGRKWMRGEISTMTSSEGGMAKGFGRMLSGESFFMSKYTAQTPAQIAFASSFPGKIIVRQLSVGESVVCQKKAFMVATAGVELSIFFQKKFGAGFFGGEGFVMQKITGPGLVFLEIDGHVVEYTLNPGERIVCDTGVLAMMDSTCNMDIERVKGIKNVLFGGEGLFDTVVTGPGRVWLQTMTMPNLASLIVPFLPSK